jgi:hypothetical protein
MSLKQALCLWLLALVNLDAGLGWGAFRVGVQFNSGRLRGEVRNVIQHNSDILKIHFDRKYRQLDSAAHIHKEVFGAKLFLDFEICHTVFLSGLAIGFTSCKGVAGGSQAFEGRGGSQLCILCGLLLLRNLCLLACEHYFGLVTGILFWMACIRDRNLPCRLVLCFLRTCR